jgi:hypothetical protein
MSLRSVFPCFHHTADFTEITSACARKSLRSDFGVNSAVVLGSGRKTLRKDLCFPALVSGARETRPRTSSIQDFL